jgi:3-hydroxyacyl-CoA dehydrogenase/enoyl-CoA hydratase/3-hydroxybutyryl-CoA epimerase
MQPYLDECRACLEDGIVENRDAVDSGMIFGTGFPPFRGGPLFYLENLAMQNEEPADE